MPTSNNKKPTPNKEVGFLLSKVRLLKLRSCIALLDARIKKNSS